MTQNIKGALAGLKGDAPPKELFKPLHEGVEGVGGGKADACRVHERTVPLAGRSLEETAGKEKLRFVVLIGIVVAHKELVEF